MRIDPLLTTSPVTGAVRHLADDLLKEVYLAPLGKPFALQELLTGDKCCPCGNDSCGRGRASRRHAWYTHNGSKRD